MAEFDRQLTIGAKVEMEHTKDPAIARQIATDHLKENPRYYDYLIRMEKQMATDATSKVVSRTELTGSQISYSPLVGKDVELKTKQGETFTGVLRREDRDGVRLSQRTSTGLSTPGWIPKKDIVAMSPKAPLFIVDENLPFYVAAELRSRGYKAKHVGEIYPTRRGVQDSEIKDYAERNHGVVLTRDTVSFPEPKGPGDRVVIRDKPRETTVQEVLDRIHGLGW
jgi:hypothetical protein